MAASRHTGKAERVSSLTKSLAKKKVDLLFLANGSNLQYFFNYSGESFERLCCVLLSIKSGKRILIAPKLDEGKTKGAAIDSFYLWRDDEDSNEILGKALADLGAKNSAIVGIEDSLSFRQLAALRKALGSPTLESVAAEISSLRIIKSEEELGFTRDAARMLTKGYQAAGAGILRPGITEREAAFEIKKVLYSAGMSSVDFCAVQAGANSAISHLETTNKKMKNGDCLVVDIAARSEEGYFADFTRTFVLGKASAELLRVHDLVQRAQSAAIAVAKEGHTAADVDAAARKIIEKEGLGSQFYHRTGHGIGLDVHEPPWIKGANHSKLAQGMAFTVEPGVYLPGKFGVRIEDNIIISKRGSEDLTPLPTELMQL